MPGLSTIGREVSVPVERRLECRRSAAHGTAGTAGRVRPDLADDLRPDGWDVAATQQQVPEQVPERVLAAGVAMPGRWDSVEK